MIVWYYSLRSGLLPWEWAQFLWYCPKFQEIPYITLLSMLCSHALDTSKCIMILHISYALFINGPLSHPYGEDSISHRVFAYSPHVSMEVMFKWNYWIWPIFLLWYLLRSSCILPKVFCNNRIKILHLHSSWMAWFTIPVVKTATCILSSMYMWRWCCSGRSMHY